MYTARKTFAEMYTAGNDERIRYFLADRFFFESNAAIDPKESLFDAGIIDPTGAMKLVFFLEEDFGIQDADGDLVPDNLDSIERIAAYVGRRAASTG